MQERHDAIAENGTCDDRSARFLAQSSLSSSLKVEAHFGPVKWLRAFACGALAVLRRHERRQFRRGFGDPGAWCAVRVGRRGRATAFAALCRAISAARRASAAQDTHETLALRATRRSGSIGFDRIRSNSKGSPRDRAGDRAGATAPGRPSPRSISSRRRTILEPPAERRWSRRARRCLRATAPTRGERSENPLSGRGMLRTVEPMFLPGLPFQLVMSRPSAGAPAAAGSG